MHMLVLDNFYSNMRVISVEILSLDDHNTMISIFTNDAMCRSLLSDFRYEQNAWKLILYISKMLGHCCINVVSVDKALYL